MIPLDNSNFTFYFSHSNSFLTVHFYSLLKQQQLELKLDIPNRLHIDEIINRLSNAQDTLFNYLITYNELNSILFKKHLQQFISEQNQLFYDDLASQCLKNYDKNQIKFYWTKVLHNNQRTVHQINNESIQAKEYHKLMHSNLMPIILEREKEYALQLNKLVNETPNNLARIQRLKRDQKVKFQQFITKLYEHNESNSTSSTSLDTLLNTLSLDDANTDMDLDDLDYIRIENNPTIPSLKKMPSLKQLTKLEESYTIQLGAQLKTTHNLRLIRCNIYDFCSNRFTKQEIEPQAIQTALSLYSNKLCSLILLSKNTVSLDEQSEHNWHHLNNISDTNGFDFHFQAIDEQKSTALVDKQLNVGDFFITKHSNLSQVHVIFHLAAFEGDDTQSNLKQSDLSSRHPVILGLRNVLKACVLNDIQTLTFPLLLTHEMTEEMTISWVMKRAELVLKCIKGFMIEFVNWGAQESRTLQFVVPQGLMDETFDSLRTLIPTIFRESRTVNLI